MVKKPPETDQVSYQAYQKRASWPVSDDRAPITGSAWDARVKAYPGTVTQVVYDRGHGTENTRQGRRLTYERCLG